MMIDIPLRNDITTKNLIYISSAYIVTFCAVLWGREGIGASEI